MQVDMQWPSWDYVEEDPATDNIRIAVSPEVPQKVHPVYVS